LHEKKEVYRRHGVKEYLVWRVIDRSVDWFRLQDGDYILVESDADGLIQSEVFPGLWLAVTDLLAGNQAGVIAKLHQGLASSEFDTFRQSLSPISID
jgi:Uma2 family endonuclease